MTKPVEVAGDGWSVWSLLNAQAMHPHVLWVMGGIGGILLVATVVSLGMKMARPGKLADEIYLRTRTWWMLAAGFGMALVATKMVSLVLFAFLSFLAFKEYLSLIPTRRADRRVLFWAYLAIPVQYWWLSFDPPWYGMFAIFVPVYVFLFLPMRMVMVGETQGFLRAVGTLHWGLMITVYALGHMAALLFIGVSDTGKVLGHGGNAGNGDGPALLLYLVFLTQFNDIAQFVWGKSLGRRKIVPTVSPNKTVEGFLGGVVTTVVLAWLLGKWLTPFTTGEALTAGLLIAFAGFIGDTTIGSLKRDLGIKDAGTMLPGHGGILDRVNSLAYTAPLFFHYVRYLYF